MTAGKKHEEIVKIGGDIMKSMVLASLLVFLGLAVFTGHASVAGETVGEYIDDSTITTEVHAIILKEPNAHYFKIDVTTTKGDVILQGLIDSRETEARIVAKVRKLRGVTSVKSLLMLKESGTGRPEHSNN
ncbi:BON domain-containing protein [Candidatus Magnetominusculus dajiuhuensis]|uniref:BON domain-containing protein n=1 Tax=Candidatus Magnetominusculus dajiuhuensis TaxID=3137712 RepID=UPI003B43B4CC